MSFKLKVVVSALLAAKAQILMHTQVFTETVTPLDHWFLPKAASYSTYSLGRHSCSQL